jgi:phosphinothricin acetyltransferase
MQVDLEPIAAEAKPLAWRLLQLSLHDFSEFDGRGPGESGEFVYDYFEHYWDPALSGREAREAYFLKADGLLAGFAFLRQLLDGRWQVAEFFVLRAFRGRGVGLAAAAALFARHPGAWEVAVHPRNTPAQRFWQRALATVGATDWETRAQPMLTWHRFTAGGPKAKRDVVTQLVVRDAIATDLPRINAIYNDAIATTVATWDEEPWPIHRRVAWWEEHAADPTTPVLVASLPGEPVVGFAYLSWYRPKAGYRSTREDTVYIDPGYHGRGIGRALLAELVARARRDGMHALVAIIEASNTASISLHARLGFRVAGREPEVGRKFGRWLDLVTMVMLLENGNAPAAGPSIP